MPKSGSLVLITGEKGLRQVSHNDFEAWDPLTDESYFFIVTGAEATPIWVADGWHNLIDMTTSV